MNASSGAVVGRDAELAALDAFLTSAQSEFSLLTLEGEPGIGKTTIWREALRRAKTACAMGFHWSAASRFREIERSARSRP